MFKLFRFLKPYWWQTIILLASIIAQVYTTLRLPAMMADIINNGIVPGDTNYIWMIGLKHNYIRPRIFKSFIHINGSCSYSHAIDVSQKPICRKGKAIF